MTTNISNEKKSENNLQEKFSNKYKTPLTPGHDCTKRRLNTPKQIVRNQITLGLKCGITLLEEIKTVAQPLVAMHY